MTFGEFLKLLPKTKWTLTDRGEIVCKGEDCPFLFVSGLIGVRRHDLVTLEMLHHRRKLFAAADNDEGHDPAIRRRLLEACGLKEKS
jgi:hypothetical protein